MAAAEAFRRVTENVLINCTSLQRLKMKKPETQKEYKSNLNDCEELV